VIASTDYMKLFAEQIPPVGSGHLQGLGTDVFARKRQPSQTASLFEVDRYG